MHAKEHQGDVEEYLKNNHHAHPGVDLNMTVLTTGFWPSYKSAELKLPVEMVRSMEDFKEYYKTKMKHRKLTWIYSLGTCIVTGKFEQRNIELVVTTYRDDVTRLLHSLACAKYKILNKILNTRTISTKDVFEFNSKFTDKMRRIKVALPLVDEKNKVLEYVDKDRRFAIDASIVRIMKSRKVLGHQQLVAECVKQLSRMFNPDFKVIKKHIEDLITRDYLERDAENPQLYRYLA
ncbi:hypothetical protein IFM89_005098 [Coptis chinensis]|uniref:Cullin family profile domain-containing protein n=1 Tax=Coptis chinensis TaxID=261450 RepID=A0A835IKX7_9MAGN|nr:hypothetical protein IFM89_005098 [Coptis chinensis]